MAGDVGFEPTHGGVKVRCLTAWRIPNMSERLGKVYRFLCYVNFLQVVLSIDIVSIIRNEDEPCARWKISHFWRKTWNIVQYSQFSLRVFLHSLIWIDISLFLLRHLHCLDIHSQHQRLIVAALQSMLMFHRAIEKLYFLPEHETIFSLCKTIVLSHQDSNRVLFEKAMTIPSRVLFIRM